MEDNENQYRSILVSSWIILIYVMRAIGKESNGITEYGWGFLAISSLALINYTCWKPFHPKKRKNKKNILYRSSKNDYV
jgi:hypothetical protein